MWEKKHCKSCKSFLYLQFRQKNKNYIKAHSKPPLTISRIEHLSEYMRALNLAGDVRNNS